MNPNILTTILHNIGLGDGDGNTSLGRVIAFLTALTVLLPKILFAIHSGGAAADFSADDLKMLSLAIASHQFTKMQETKTEPPPPPP